MTIVIINLFGWIWSRTRILNLITLFITAFSWFGLGLIYQIGYCPLTQWHWQVKEKLGVQGLPDSYVKYYVDLLFGINSNPKTVDMWVFIIFALAWTGALVTLFKTRKK